MKKSKSSDVPKKQSPLKNKYDNKAESVNENFFRAMFESHQAVMLLIDPDTGKIIDANNAAINFYKYSKQELKRLNIQDINQLKPDQVKKEWTRALKDERNYFVFPHKLADGQIRQVEVYSSAFIFSNKPVLYSIIHDVTEKKTAEEALRKSEEKYEIAFKLNPNAIILSALESGEIYEVNDSFSRLTGLKRDEAIGKSTLDLDIYVSPDDRNKMIEQLKNRGSLKNHEIKLKQKGGKILETLASSEILKTSMGKTILTTFQDITTRKKLEEQQKKEHDLLQVIFDTVPAMITVYDPEIKEVQLNKEVERVTGWTSNDFKTKNIMELAYPDPIYRNEIADYMQSLAPGFRDVEMTCKDGTVKNTLWANVSTSDKRRIGIGIDISERIKAQEELLKSQTIISTALASMTDAVYISDNTGKLIEYNDAFYSFYRLETETMFSMQISQYNSLFNFYFPDGKLATLEELPIARALRGEQVKKTEYSIHKTDTGDNWVGSFSFSPIRNNEGIIIGSVIVARDITDTKIAETERERLIEQLANEKEALAESEQRYRLMGEAVDYGVWAADAEGKITYLSHSFCKLIGKSIEELKEHGWHENLVIQQSHKIMDLWMHSVKTGEPYEHEHLIFGRNGEKKHILARAQPIRNQKGEITSWAGIHLDITERKEANEKLEQQYKNLTRINKVLEDFVHIAAHDLRSPIGNLINLSELINRQDDIGRKAELFSMSLPITRRLQHTVDGLFEMVNIQMEEEVHAKRLRFSKVWKTVEEVLAHEINNFQGSIEKDFGKAPEIVYSEVHLISILRNLVSNAIKYSDEDKEPKIRVCTKRENDFILLEVHDNGIGIDLKKAKDGLFKPFKRFTNQAGGTGMGLYLVKNIVEKNGGYVKVESKPGKGTSFYCYLREYPTDSLPKQ